MLSDDQRLAIETAWRLYDPRIHGDAVGLIIALLQPALAYEFARYPHKCTVCKKQAALWLVLGSFGLRFECTDAFCMTLNNMRCMRLTDLRDAALCRIDVC